MKKIILSLVIVSLVASLAYAGQPIGKRIIFLIQPDRQRETLEHDADLIFKVMQDMKTGDSMEGMSLDGKQVFSLHIVKKNPLEMKRDRNTAINAIRKYYLSLINNPPADSKTDIAGALKRGIQRANSVPGGKTLLVFLSGGIQKSPLLDMSKAYPSDSFAVSQKSVFSIVPQALDGKVEVLFITQSSDYVSPLHSQKVERFYRLLLIKRKASLMGWTDDHETALEIIRSGRKLQAPAPEPVNESGPLILYQMNGSARYIEKTDSDPTSMNIQKKPVNAVRKADPPDISCPLMRLGIDKGLATIWISLRDPHDNPVTDLGDGDLRIYESSKEGRRLIPPGDIKLHSKKPMAIMVLRDVSLSLDQTGLDNSETAIKAFLDMMSSQDAASLVNFKGNASVMHKFTLDKEAVKKSMRVPLLRSGTCLNDAILFAIDELQRLQGEYLRAVVAFTDGFDTTSKHTASEALKAAKESSIPLFLIGIGSVDASALSKLARDSGGMYLPVPDTRGLERMYAKLSDVMNNSILISYPTVAKSGEVKVDLAVGEKVIASSSTRAR